MEAGIGMIGLAACLGLSAAGSALGVGIAGQATIGAWKKCFLQNKAVPFLLLAFAVAPLTQKIYGFILMNTMKASSLDDFAKLGIGLFAGLAIGASALYQGKCSASASDAFAETGQGFGNYILIIGLVETIALFVMVFAMGLVG